MNKKILIINIGMVLIASFMIFEIASAIIWSEPVTTPFYTSSNYYVCSSSGTQWKLYNPNTEQYDYTSSLNECRKVPPAVASETFCCPVSQNTCEQVSGQWKCVGAPITIDRCEGFDTKQKCNAEPAIQGGVGEKSVEAFVGDTNFCFASKEITGSDLNVLLTELGYSSNVNVNCVYYITSCKCEWNDNANNGAGACEQKFETSLFACFNSSDTRASSNRQGVCSISSKLLEGDCQATDFLKYEVNTKWKEPNKEECLPKETSTGTIECKTVAGIGVSVNTDQIKTLKCLPRTVNVPCISTTKISFFTGASVVVVIVLIVLIYYLLSRKKHQKNEKSSSRIRKKNSVKKRRR